MKIRPVGVEMFHADKQTNRKTYMKRLIVAFRNFANAPNKTAVFAYSLRDVNGTRRYEIDFVGRREHGKI